MKKTILGIETSCDETSVSIIEAEEEKIKILSNIVSSQIDIHKKYGGVVPEVASRAHLEAINFIAEQSLRKAKKKLSDIELFTVTCGPGLAGGLAVGFAFAQALARIKKKPLLCINHLEGHIYANFISQKIKFPAIVLIVSGGHTQIILMKNHLSYKILGDTKDDAAGEAFDKVAKILGIEYPGGPIIEELAKKGDKDAYVFPQSEMKSNITRDKEGFLIKVPPSLNFSFSGLKTAVLYEVKRSKKIKKVNIAASFQKAVIDVLVRKTIWAAKRYNTKSILLSGGVSANKKLQKELEQEAKKNNFSFFHPKINLSTDNAAMIAIAGYFRYVYNKEQEKFINPNLKIA